MHTNWCVLIEISMEIGMLNFWLGLLVTAHTKKNYFSVNSKIADWSRTAKMSSTIIDIATLNWDRNSDLNDEQNYALSILSILQGVSYWNVRF